MATKHYIVSGRVQGVFFRMFVLEQASNLGLRGWVRNLTDGTVEVLASGDEDRLRKLLDSLHVGPPAARVDSVKEIAVPQNVDLPNGFHKIATASNPAA